MTPFQGSGVGPVHNDVPRHGRGKGDERAGQDGGFELGPTHESLFIRGALDEPAIAGVDGGFRQAVAGIERYSEAVSCALADEAAGASPDTGGVGEFLGKGGADVFAGGNEIAGVCWWGEETHGRRILISGGVRGPRFFGRFRRLGGGWLRLASGPCWLGQRRRGHWFAGPGVLAGPVAESVGTGSAGVIRWPECAADDPGGSSGHDQGFRDSHGTPSKRGSLGGHLRRFRSPIPTGRGG